MRRGLELMQSLAGRLVDSDSLSRNGHPECTDPFAHKDLNMMWNNLSLIRTTVVLPSGQHYQLLRPECRGWIWKLIPCTSIWPIPNQHQGQSSPTSGGHRTPRINWHDKPAKLECTYFIWISKWQEFLWNVPSYNFTQFGCVAGGGAALGFGTCVLLLQACWVNLSYSRQYTSKPDKIPLVEKCNFELERDEAWIQALTWSYTRWNRSLNICFWRCIIGIWIGECVSFDVSDCFFNI